MSSTGQDDRSPFFNPFEDIDKHERNLPHWQQGQVWQFVTWRLADSLPQSRLESWKTEREEWLRLHPLPWNETTTRDYNERFGAWLEEWLDAGHGACVLRRPEVAAMVGGALQHFDAARYQLAAFVVMPNHVHVLFRPMDGYELKSILHSWKSFTANQINILLGRKGMLWQEEYWDRMVRSEAQWWSYLRYVEENPKKAKLKDGEYFLYLGSNAP